jgi:branched-chain amino acid transport system permease protein
VQLTVYSLILVAVILWRPSGLIGVVAETYARFFGSGRLQETVIDA